MLTFYKKICKVKNERHIKNSKKIFLVSLYISFLLIYIIVLKYL